MNNKEKIHGILMDEGDWMSITQVAERVGLTRTTASKYLSFLVYEGRAETREMGPARIFRVKEG